MVFIYVSVIAVAVNSVTAFFIPKNRSVCSDYYLIGRTFNECLTDKNLSE